MRLAGAVAAGLLLSYPAAAKDSKAEQWADAVVKASGGDNWARVKAIDFTFNVEKDGKPLVSAKHHWDVAAGTDTVTWKGKTVSVNVTVAPAQGEEKEAYQRWTNDSYWLLAPLKLRDSGTVLKYVGEQEAEGKKWEVIELSFASVGMTPHDHYNLYIDPEKNLIGRWDYMPTPEKKVSGTWENYRSFDGLTLSTEHAFGGNRIYFTDLNVSH